MNMNKFLLAAVLIAALPACTMPDLQEFIGAVNRTVGFELFKYKKKTLPDDVKDEMAAASDPHQSPGQSALAKANSELLAEMMKVVFHSDQVQDRSEYGGLTHSLNQGASLEGIYRGIVMGSRYRGMENGSSSASPKVLKAFVLEMVDLQATMKNPTEFQIEEAKKAPTIEYPDGEPAHHGVGSKQDTQEVKQKKERTVAINELLHIFIGASQYTLKRVLADEGMKKLDELKDAPGELAQWYAKFVLHMCGTGVDFGLELRNRPDFDFHFKFAQRMAPDRVKWEVVNRYHRYLNYVIDHEN
jgi:hypothetical protein